MRQTYDVRVRFVWFAAVVLPSCFSTAPLETADADAPDAHASDAPKQPDALADASADDVSAPIPIETCGVPATFAPSWKAPSPFGQRICSADQVQAILSCIFDPNADQAACAAVNADENNQACADCLLTPDTAKALGPLVTRGQVASLNVAGCIANAARDRTANGCGAKVQAASDCVDAACNDTMPCTDAGGVADCEKRARTSSCASFVTASDACAGPLLASDGGAHECAVGDASTFLSDAIRLGTLFCAGVADAGSDG